MTAAVETRLATIAWGFTPYAAVSLAHVALLGLDHAWSYPTKLLLMPALIFAVLWGLRGIRFGAASTRSDLAPAGGLLLAAIVLSWLGDGAAFFFPGLDDELPAMLLAFGLAHVAYIALFARHLAVRRPPLWTLVYAVWWIVLVAVLWPLLGALALAVAVYGLVLGGTAVMSARCSPAVALGGAFFLASDTILAFRIFVPQTPEWLGVTVMVTYTLGQGLIAWGAVRQLRAPKAEA